MDDDGTQGSFSDAPPSYDDATIPHPGSGTSPSASSHPASRSGSEPATRLHLQTHIASLPSRIRDSSQRARTAQQQLDDALLVDHIAPAIEAFLIDLGAQGGAVATTPQLASATLTIVPDGAVPPQAELSGLAEMRGRGELGRLSRIRVGSDGKKDGHNDTAKNEKENNNTKEKDDSLSFAESTFASAVAHSSSSSSSPPFSFSSSSSPDYNAAAAAADLLWWRDEAMARRLAGCLQPKAAAAAAEGKSQAERLRPSTSTTAVQTAVEMELPPEKQKRGWGWGKWRNGRRGPAPQGAAATETTLKSRPQQQQQQKTTQAQGQDGAYMMVEAQEVAFRVENDLGILESMRGWGIVLTVDVRQLVRYNTIAE